MPITSVDVKAEYVKDKNLKEKDVQLLVDWTNKQFHLPKINEFQAILFLKKCSYKIEPAKTTIDTYFTVKTFWTELFAERVLLNSSFKGILDVVLMSALPKKTQEGDTIIFVKPINSEVVNYELAMYWKYFDIITTLNIYQQGTSNGHIIILDVKEMPYSYVSKLDVATFKRQFYYIQELMPIHLKAIHFINPPSFMDEMLAILESGAPKALLPAIYKHTSINDLLKYVPRECLPQDYGGSLETTTVLLEKVKNNFLENAAFFAWEEQQTVDETKRPSENKIAKDILGFKGIFYYGPQ